jgi:hypothetical protein
MRYILPVVVVVVVVAAAAALAIGCRGKIMGTASLAGPGIGDASFTSTGAPGVLWADTDGKWRGGKRSHFAAH